MGIGVRGKVVVLRRSADLFLFPHYSPSVLQKLSLTPEQAVRLKIIESKL
jgi:hypothetical protein